MFNQASDHVRKECIRNDRQDIYAYRLDRVINGSLSCMSAVDWGVIVECADFAMQEARIGSLSLDAIDFGERLRLSAIIRETSSMWRS